MLFLLARRNACAASEAGPPRNRTGDYLVAIVGQLAKALEIGLNESVPSRMLLYSPQARDSIRPYPQSDPFLNVASKAQAVFVSDVSEWVLSGHLH